MLERLKKRFSRIASDEPGERFRWFHERGYRKRGASPWKKVLYIIGGTVLILMGVLSSIIPGVPGFVLVLAGLGIIATRSRAFAHLLDRLELAVRRIFKRMWDLL